MKIVFQNVILLLSFVAYNYFCLAKDSVRLGVFINDNQQKIPLNWNIIEENINEDIEFIRSDIELVSDINLFDATKSLCNLASKEEERLIGTFGPGEHIISDTLESLCSYLNVPYITTTWKPATETSSDNVFNLYPEAGLLSRGLARIVDSFNWPGFVILYEDDDGLLKLQEVLKLQKHGEDDHLNDVTLRKLNSEWDNRPLLKSIRSSSTPNRIILDCHVDRIMGILQQAIEVRLLSDFSTSFFLTSMDAHTLDYSALKTLANITTLRLFDPMATHFQTIVSNYFPETEPTKLKVETALLHDAMVLVTETINVLKLKEVEISPKELLCSAPEKYSDDLGLANTIKGIELTDTLTGPVSLKSGKRENFVLDVIEISRPEKPIAIWNSETPDKIHLTRNATEREAEFQKRMESYNFIVSSRIGPPYLYKSSNPDAYGNARYYGYSMDLITHVAKFMNITFEFRITKDNSYSNLLNDLIERKADMAICDFTITPQRREVIDFSMPFMNLGIGILHKESAHEEVDNMYAFMRPLSWTVWFYIWTLMLANSLVMVIVARLSPGEWENPKPWDPESKELENIWTIKNFLWLALGSISAQGCDILPKSAPTRVISGAFWFFSLIITSSYTANLAAFLTMDKKDITIDNVEELAAQSKVKYGLLAKGSTESFFSTSNNSLYQKMWNTMKNERPSVFEADNNKGVERVNSTNNALYAFFMESTGIEFELERQCNLRKIGNLLDSKSYGIGMPMNAEYRHSINLAILFLQESGKLMELKEIWWKKEREGEPCNRDVEEKSEALALSNVGGIFIVLSIGIGLAYFLALIEFLWHVGRLSAEEHLSYMETLKCEVKFACKIFTKKKRAKPLPSESSSSKSDIDNDNHDKLSIAKSLFSKSASLLNFNMDTESGLKHRHRSPSRTSRNTSNHLRVN
nr:glutamate receptor ionotropic 4 [Pachyrhinus yasumatsui]